MGKEKRGGGKRGKTREKGKVLLGKRDRKGGKKRMEKCHRKKEEEDGLQKMNWINRMDESVHNLLKGYVSEMVVSCQPCINIDFPHKNTCKV